MKVSVRRSGPCPQGPCEGCQDTGYLHTTMIVYDDGSWEERPYQAGDKTLGLNVYEIGRVEGWWSYDLLSGVYPREPGRDSYHERRQADPDFALGFCSGWEEARQDWAKVDQFRT